MRAPRRRCAANDARDANAGGASSSGTSVAAEGSADLGPRRLPADQPAAPVTGWDGRRHAERRGRDKDGTSTRISAGRRIIDAAATATGNGIDFGGVTFSISNESGYLSIARKQAMQSAMTEATQVAAGARTAPSRASSKVTDQESSSAPASRLPVRGAR